MYTQSRSDSHHKHTLLEVSLRDTDCICSVADATVIGGQLLELRTSTAHVEGKYAINTFISAKPKRPEERSLYKYGPLSSNLTTNTREFAASAPHASVETTVCRWQFHWMFILHLCRINYDPIAYRSVRPAYTYSNTTISLSHIDFTTECSQHHVDLSLYVSSRHKESMTPQSIFSLSWTSKLYGMSYSFIKWATNVTFVVRLQGAFWRVRLKHHRLCETVNKRMLYILYWVTQSRSPPLSPDEKPYDSTKHCNIAMDLRWTQILRTRWRFARCLNF